MNNIYLVVYMGNIYGEYYKFANTKYKVFSSKRKAKKYINNKIKNFSKKGTFSERDKEKTKYFIYKKIIDEVE